MSRQVRRTGKSFIRVPPSVARPPSMAGTYWSPVRAPAADRTTTQSRPEPDCWPVPEGYAADEAVAAMTARFPRTFGARISGFPCSSPVGEGAASGSAYGCTSPCLPAANIYRRSPSSSACNDGQWSCAPYLPARVGRCPAARQQRFPGEGMPGPLATVTSLGSQMKTTAATLPQNSCPGMSGG